METFSALLAFCAGNSPVPLNSPHKGQWRGALMFSLICARINNWVNNREACDLRRHRGHYDVNVLVLITCTTILVMRGFKRLWQVTMIPQKQFRFINAYLQNENYKKTSQSCQAGVPSVIIPGSLFVNNSLYPIDQGFTYKINPQNLPFPVRLSIDMLLDEVKVTVWLVVKWANTIG